MRVFITGGTGFIGSAIVRELVAEGHDVVGLARSDRGAAALARAGVRAHRGDLTDVASLADGARGCDGVVHAAFNHDFDAYEANADVDRGAIEVLTRALEERGGMLVSTSVSVLLTAGRIGRETDPLAEGGALGMRAAAEEAALAAAARGVRASAIRLPPSVHGAGDRGFVPALIGIARRSGFAAYVGEGMNRWGAVHRLDAARVYRSVLDGADASGVFHAVAEGGITMREIAEAIGRGLGLPTRSITYEDAGGHFGWLTPFATLDNPMASDLTRERLGWQPEQPGLIADMADAGYFGGADP